MSLPKPANDDYDYKPYIVLDTRGQGLVGLATCKRCGAAVLLQDDNAEVHSRSHAQTPPSETGGSGA